MKRTLELLFVVVASESKELLTTQQYIGDYVTTPDSYLDGHSFLVGDFRLSYGEITALCGEYYMAQPISNSASGADQEEAFKATFSCLNTSTYDPRNVLKAPNGGSAAFHSFKERFSKLDSCYSYVESAMDNPDHFANFEGGSGGHWEAYSAGHRVACREAAAGNTELAYMYNACGSHYLSAAFSPGNLVTPVRELTPLDTWNMKNEVDYVGLTLINARKDIWYGYGEECTGASGNSVHTALHLEALTASAAGIYGATRGADGLQRCLADTTVREVIPDSHLLQDTTVAQAVGNIPPMFRLQPKGVEVRNPFQQVESYTWKLYDDERLAVLVNGIKEQVFKDALASRLAGTRHESRACFPGDTLTSMSSTILDAIDVDLTSFKREFLRRVIPGYTDAPEVPLPDPSVTSTLEALRDATRGDSTRLKSVVHPLLGDVRLYGDWAAQFEDTVLELESLQEVDLCSVILCRGAAPVLPIEEPLPVADSLDENVMKLVFGMTYLNDALTSLQVPLVPSGDLLALVQEAIMNATSIVAPTASPTFDQQSPIVNFTATSQEISSASTVHPLGTLVVILLLVTNINEPV